MKGGLEVYQIPSGKGPVMNLETIKVQELIENILKQTEEVTLESVLSEFEKDKRNKFYYTESERKEICQRALNALVRKGTIKINEKITDLTYSYARTKKTASSKQENDWQH